jgi:hypothetical protein
MSTPNNPDFSAASKQKIARATRIVLGTPANNTDTARPAFPRGGGSVLPPGNKFTSLIKINDFQDVAFVLPIFT